MKSLHKDSWKANVSLYQKDIFCNKTNEIYIGNKEKYIINPKIHILISKILHNYKVHEICNPEQIQ